MEMDPQRIFWNEWNTEAREQSISEISRRQAEVIDRWLSETTRNDLKILEVGCGAGWLSPILTRYGTVTATDLSDEVLGRAQRRYPEVRFIAGDFASLSLEPHSFDVIVTLEVLSHIEDQGQFLEHISDLLVPGGLLLLATQNRTVLEEYCVIAPAKPGQLRRWVTCEELEALVRKEFLVGELFTVTPVAHRGWRRLLTSQKLNRLLHPLFGNTLRDALEARRWGWTIMLKASRR